MQRWLFKQEPSAYSYYALEKEGETVWDGVSNNLALKYLRMVSPGDTILFYHSGNEKQIVGIMKAVRSAPEEMGNAGNTPAPKVAPVMRLPKPITLSQIKSDPVFAGWELVRISRLSVMPVMPPVWSRIAELAGLKASDKALQLL